MPYRSARVLLGDNSIIGLSTHNPDQTLKACLLKPDYIGIGPVFPTPTKANPDPVIGIEGMKKMLQVSTVPAVAIGGITSQSLPHLLAAGVKNFSLVRPLNQAQEPEKVLKEILAIYNKEIEGAYEI
jgi:thiamine-phosphate pyrophosphorylase